MGIIRSFADYFWNMVFDFLIEEKEYEVEEKEEEEEEEISPESYVDMTFTKPVEDENLYFNPTSLEWEHF